MNNKTVKIRIWGIVQGVGFRPFTAKLADRMGMRGEVLNVGGLVCIFLTDSEDRIRTFIDVLQREKPEPSEIVHIEKENVSFRDYTAFTITGSDDGGDEAAMIPSDLAICEDCLEELFDEENPRFMHPFISCMACGPRYSIIDKIPYDRDNTAMIDFPMCDFCSGEYRNIEDRRFHAQTISCHDCGPKLIFKSRDEAKVTSSLGIIGWNGLKENEPERYEKVLSQVLNPIIESTLLLAEGKIIALKGIGGYNFICDPLNDSAVRDLRKLKGREEKPFAVMFKDIQQIKSYCKVTEEEERLLLSSARPIVLLPRQSDAKPLSVPNLEDEADKAQGLICEGTYRSSRFIGAFLPSFGAQHILLSYKSPLIVTSANFSDMPIIIDDQEIFAFMEKESLLAGVLYNEREIRIRLDDSVVRVIDGEPQIIRRAKGYAPVPLYMSGKTDKIFRTQILATGGQLKSAFSLSKGNFSYVSQHFGDLDSRENFKIYEENVERMKSLFRIEPALIVTDRHPLYNTTRYAEDMVFNILRKQNIDEEDPIKILRVQHHHAHIASVMAEHNLEGGVIGVAFDGTGYGNDGNIWGGEFLVCEGVKFKRAAHLAYVKMLGGDSSMKEGWKSAMSYLYHYEKSMTEGSNKVSRSEKIQDNNKTMEKGGSCKEINIDLSEIIEFSRIKENENWPIVKTALDNRINTIESSSMGRLFDAVASLLDIQHINRYEGECAIMLENAAAYALECPGVSKKNDLALKFHMDVAQMILKVCKEIKEGYKTQSDEKAGRVLNQVALSGGVFQNKILMEKTLELLRKEGFKVYFNISVPPNDGGIAFGQNYIGMQTMLCV